MCHLCIFETIRNNFNRCVRKRVITCVQKTVSLDVSKSFSSGEFETVLTDVSENVSSGVSKNFSSGEFETISTFVSQKRFVALSEVITRSCQIQSHYSLFIKVINLPLNPDDN